MEFLLEVPALTGAAVLALGLSVLARNFRSRTARLFFNFALFYFLTAGAASLLRLAPREEDALFWARLFYFFHVMMVNFLLGAVAGFLGTPFFKRRSATLAFPVIAPLAGILPAALIPAGGVEGGGGEGFYVEPGPATLVHALIGAAYTSVAMGLLLWNLPRARGRFRRQVLVLAAGLAAPAALGGLTAVFRLAYDAVLPPVVNFGAVVTGLCLYTATLRLRLWVTPAGEERAETAPRYSLEPRSVYLVEEARPEKAYDIFKDAVTHGLPGLLISRQDPEVLRGELGLRQVPILQITSAPGDYRINPKDLGDLVEQVAKFLKQAGDAVLLLDCFEYLAAERGFKSAFSTFNTLVDIAQVRGARVLLSLSPKALPEDEAALLRKHAREAGKR